MVDGAQLPSDSEWRCMNSDDEYQVLGLIYGLKNSVEVLDMY